MGGKSRHNPPSPRGGKGAICGPASPGVPRDGSVPTRAVGRTRPNAPDPTRQSAAPPGPRGFSEAATSHAPPRRASSGRPAAQRANRQALASTASMRTLASPPRPAKWPPSRQNNAKSQVGEPTVGRAPPPQRRENQVPAATPTKWAINRHNWFNSQSAKPTVGRAPPPQWRENQRVTETKSSLLFPAPAWTQESKPPRPPKQPPVGRALPPQGRINRRVTEIERLLLCQAPAWPQEPKPRHRHRRNSPSVGRASLTRQARSRQSAGPRPELTPPSVLLLDMLP